MKKTEWDAILNKLKSNRFTAINMRKGVDRGVTEEGGLSWNDLDHTLDIHTGVGDTIIQVGQETVGLIHNNTGDVLLNGRVIHPTNGDFTSGGISDAEYVSSKDFTDINGGLAILTSDLPDGEVGFATIIGRVRDFDTTGLILGDVFIAPSDPPDGTLTSVRPQFPDYSIQMGRVSKLSATEGQIIVDQTNRITDTVFSYFLGNFREKFDLLVTSNGTIITATLDSDVVDNLTAVWSDGLALFSVPASVTLTPGSDTISQTNYIYVSETTRVLTTNTTGFPVGEHIRGSVVEVWSATKTQAYGAKKNQNWNNYLQDQTTQQGQLARILERLRQNPAKWDVESNGISGTLTIDPVSDPDDVFVSTTAGKVYQIGLQDWIAQDTEVDDVVFIANDSISPDKPLANLNAQTLDANGDSLVNRSFSFVLWGQQNKGGTNSHMFINLPIGSYLQVDASEQDSDNFTVYDLPSELGSTAFLIARFNLSLSASGSGTWTLNSKVDLRGFTPNTVAGGTGGGGGVSTWLELTDTPSSYTTFAGNLPYVNALETGLEFASDLHWDAVNNRLGIGTTTPTHKLDVNGIIGIDGEQTIYNAQALDGFTGSLFVGDGGGSLSHTAGSEGYFNTGVGIGALLDNTTGNFNTASGVNALRLNTTGNGNTASGYAALQNNTTGSSNVASGYQALLSNTTGSSNTASGYAAGRFIADGSTSNLTGDFNLFLGRNTKALADNDQNEIVIGYNAIGIGSNSVVLGNDSITKTYLKGNLGINGTPTTTSTLNVTGLPTSSAGLVSGDVWNNSGVLTIV